MTVAAAIDSLVRWKKDRKTPPVSPRMEIASFGPGNQAQIARDSFDAMALARPIVSTAVGMIPEILQGCGVLVAPGDVVALAAALHRLLGDPASAEALGRRARARCQAHYSFTAARAALFPLIEHAAVAR